MIKSAKRDTRRDISGLTGLATAGAWRGTVGTEAGALVGPWPGHRWIQPGHPPGDTRCSKRGARGRVRVRRKPRPPLDDARSFAPTSLATRAWKTTSRFGRIQRGLTLPTSEIELVFPGHCLAARNLFYGGLGWARMRAASLLSQFGRRVRLPLLTRRSLRAAAFELHASCYVVTLIIGLETPAGARAVMLASSTRRLARSEEALA